MSELGDFLRSRREGLPPEKAGLPRGSRRRTPGLRRGELATLAGVSVEYLARLEQGRDRHPSAQVIGALADALQLSDADRLHLRSIAKAQDGVACLIVEPPATEVSRAVRMVLDRLEPSPAVVLNRISDVLAFTEGFRLLAEPIGLLETGNLARYVFTDPRARDVYPEWDAVADLRGADLPHASDPYVTDDLARSSAAPPTGERREVLRHPDVGELRLRPETMVFPDAGDLRLVLYLPHDDDTSERLDRLVRTGPRVVGTVRLDTSASGVSDAAPRALVPTRSRIASQRTTRP
ncbi:helix-turn-helix domain-containing protein [Cryptosporangium arvum]|uniref:MmyB family transcriptional regulator n=1 Tax=Cryptosporangium arvum TaxID=80871 RepID=UPI0004B845C5